MSASNQRQIGNAIAEALCSATWAETSRLLSLLRSTAARISKPRSLRAAHRSEIALQLYAIRRERHQFFNDDIFGEPAWDILLILYWAEMEQLRLTVSNVCDAACVPQTTALRWINKLELDGTILRAPHPYDGRVFRLSLSEHAVEMMDRLMDRSIAIGLSNQAWLPAAA
jgi:DNA-binding MarR family transcriptional regulator